MLLSPQWVFGFPCITFTLLGTHKQTQHSDPVCIYIYVLWCFWVAPLPCESHTCEATVTEQKALDRSSIVSQVLCAKCTAVYFVQLCILYSCVRQPPLMLCVGLLPLMLCVGCKCSPLRCEYSRLTLMPANWADRQSADIIPYPPLHLHLGFLIPSPFLLLPAISSCFPPSSLVPRKDCTFPSPTWLSSSAPSPSPPSSSPARHVSSFSYYSCQLACPPLCDTVIY